jgi:hypothetical protein
MTTAADKRWFAAVASLETCSLCGAYGVQIAHQNEGRGIGQKAKGYQIAALCPACHHDIDNGSKLDREARLSLMRLAINRTRDRLIEAGKLRLA